HLEARRLALSGAPVYLESRNRDARRFRHPGESRDPLIRRRDAGQMDPGFRRDDEKNGRSDAIALQEREPHMLDGKRILLIISGGIAAYKSLELIRRLGERGVA